MAKCVGHFRSAGVSEHFLVVYHEGMAALPPYDEQFDVPTGFGPGARWLEEVLSGLGLDRVHLLGTSIGGWAAVNLAVRHRGRVASLTLLDPVMTLDGVPPKVLLASLALTVPGVPGFGRRRVLS